MNDLAALGLLWLFGQSKQPQQQAARTGPPQWPSPLSPPPMPAFQSQIPPPPAPTAETGTPLSELHQAPPKVRAAAPPQGAALRSAAAAAVRAADAARRSVKVPLHVTLPTRAKATPATPQRTAAAVIDVQKLVNARGGKLKPDGLYGPKTASAWSALARSKGLPATITRGGPRTAMVDSRTLDTLRVPAIP